MFRAGGTMKRVQDRLLFCITLFAIVLLLQAPTSRASSTTGAGCDIGPIQLTSQFTSCSHTMMVPLALEGAVNPGDSSQRFQAFLVYQTGAPAISQIEAAWDDFNFALLTLRQLGWA